LGERHRERMREKMIDNGAKTFQDHELLEMLLYKTHAQKNTNPIAHELIRAFGSFSAVFDAEIEELLEIDGVGKQSAHLIKLIPAIARAYTYDKNNRDGNSLVHTEEICRYLTDKYIDKVVETSSVILMDNKYMVLKWCILSEGIMNASTVNLRKLMELVVKHKATKIILAHNHPSGIALPTASDEITTQAVRDLLMPIGVKLHDHIIIAGDEGVSMKDTPAYRYLFVYGENK